MLFTAAASSLAHSLHTRRASRMSDNDSRDLMHCSCTDRRKGNVVSTGCEGLVGMVTAAWFAGHLVAPYHRMLYTQLSCYKHGTMQSIAVEEPEELAEATLLSTAASCSAPRMGVLPGCEDRSPAVIPGAHMIVRPP